MSSTLEWGVILAQSDPNLGSSGLAMAMTSATLKNTEGKRPSDTTFVEVWLANFAGPFAEMQLLARDNSEIPTLSRTLRTAKKDNPLDEKIAMILKGWMVQEPDSARVDHDWSWVLEILKGTSTTEAELETLKMVWTMLKTSQTSWHIYVIEKRYRQRQSLAHDIAHVVEWARWNQLAFQSTNLFRFRQEMLNCLGDARDMGCWDGPIPEPEGWGTDDWTVDREAEQGLVRENDAFEVERELETLRKLAYNGSRVYKVVRKVGDTDATTMIQEPDPLVIQGFNLIQAVRISLRWLTP